MKQDTRKVEDQEDHKRRDWNIKDTKNNKEYSVRKRNRGISRVCNDDPQGNNRQVKEEERGEGKEKSLAEHTGRVTGDMPGGGGGVKK